MSKPKWTAEAWRSHDMEAGTIVAGRPGLAVALVEAMTRTPEENEANFRLCLAAPDLYAALEAMVKDLGWDEEGPDTPLGPFAQVMSALAKARGEA